MEGYSMKEMVELTGLSERTLRYYDSSGLVCPKREDNGYRRYGSTDIDRLQQVMLLRDAGMPLAKVRETIDADGYDAIATLREQADRLEAKRDELGRAAETVRRTIRSMEEGKSMKDIEKFEGIKRDMVDENERRYGSEIRERFGDETVDASNAKVMGMSESAYRDVNALQDEIAEKLKVAMQTGDATCDEAREVCELHARWLESYWPDGAYSKSAHAALAEAYVTDERFSAYYDAIAAGAARFLRDAIVAWAAEGETS